MTDPVTDPIQITKNLRRESLSVDVLIPNEDNPNEMTDQQFNLLCQSIEEGGFIDPLYVRDLGNDTYRVVGGHHRLEVGKLLGFEEVPCTIVDNDKLGEDLEKFQMVKLNTIHGQMSPQKFAKLYEQLSEDYQDEVMQEMMGFASQEEFNKLIKTTGASLPPEMKQEFKEAAKEIKTIDDLALILNTLFTKHGDTLDYNYMLVDFGGKESIWLRMTKKQKVAFLKLADQCRKEHRSMDAIMEGLILSLCDHGEAVLEEIIASTPEVTIPEDSEEIPTLDFLDSE